MSTTLTQISNIFNLMCQADTRIKYYHYGWRSDINKNVANNFDPKFSKGRQFPAVHLDKPDGFQEDQEPSYIEKDETIEMILYFDTLQDYNNDGSANTLNLIEQEDALKIIANDFMANVVEVIGVDKYNIGHIDKPKYVVRSNLHNQKLITWEVSFNLTHQTPCTEDQYKIDLDLLPDTIEGTDIERGDSAVDACLALLASLTEEQRNECLLPTYNFADDDVWSNTTPEQHVDMTARLCTAPVLPQSSIILDGISDYILAGDIPQYSDFDFNKPWSFTARVKVSNVSVISPVVSKRSGTYIGFVWQVNAGELRLVMRDTNPTGIDITSSGAGLINNTWTTIGFSSDGSGNASGIKMSVNGALVTLAPPVSDTLGGSILSSEDLRFGVDVHNRLGGSLGYIRGWNIELSAADFLADHNDGLMLESAIHPANLIVGWKGGQGAMAGPTEMVFPDESNNNFNPSISGMGLPYSAISSDVPT